MGNLERAKNITTMEKLVQGTAVNASGTSVDFTGIPSWVKRITVMFNGVSTNGTSLLLVQIGSGAIKTSGYLSGCSFISNVVGSSNTTTGFMVSNSSNSAHIRSGIINIVNFDSNKWVSSAVMGLSNNTETGLSAGYVTADGVLDRVRITTINGTDVFDAGTINIMYEG